VGGNAAYVVQPLDAMRSLTPTGGSTTTEHFVTSKPSVHGDLVSCTVTVTVTGPDVVVALAPAS